MGKGNWGARIASEMGRVEEKGWVCSRWHRAALPALERCLAQLLSGEELA